MEIDESEKIDILLNLLNERYSASHKIRERSLRLTIWILGLAVAFIWILVSGTSLTLHQKWILTVIVAVLGGVSFWFVYALERGFDKNREVMIDLEEALGCYQEGLYIDSKALYPNEYKQLNNKSRFSHFKSIYILTIPIAILIILLIWFKPSKEAQGPTSEQTKHQSPVQTEKVERRQ